MNLLPPCSPSGSRAAKLCHSSGQVAIPWGQLPQRPPHPGSPCHHCRHAAREGHERRGNLTGRQGKASIHTVSLSCGISNLLLKKKKKKRQQQFSPQTSSLSRAIHARGFMQHLTPKQATLISNLSSKQTRYQRSIFLPSPSFPLETENGPQAVPVRAVVPPPQTKAAGSTKPLNTTDLPLANNGIERP